MSRCLTTYALLLCFLGGAILADERAKDVERPPAPQGFQWQELEEISGAVLLPREWHFSKTSTRDSVAFRVTQEVADKGFLTGLTVNVVQGVIKKSKAPPSLYAVHYVDTYMKGAKVIVQPKVDKTGSFARVTCEVEKELPVAKGTTFRIRLVTLASDETDVLYVLTFGAPQTEWEKAWKTGSRLLDSIVLPAAPTERVVAAKINRIRLYVPTGELEDRLGDDPKLISEYIKAIERGADKIISAADKPKAKGLLLAVGMKGNKATRMWCQAIDGEAPDELLRKLEKELATIEPCALKQPPMAFALELNLWGQKVEKFPEFPDAWLEVAEKSKTAILVPPDELFKSLWPD